jgi:hypothetical protein
MNAVLLAGVLVALGACTTLPSGPGVLVLPGTGKSFDEFKANEFECRQYASAQVGGTSPNDVAADNAVRNAAVGTAVGALAGAVIGGRQGAGVGAGTGLVVGAAAGSGTGEYSGRALQQRYDFAYLQCMYARGNRVPVSGRFEAGPRGMAEVPRGTAAPQPAQPQPGAMPPPPPGNPPPPPPASVPPPQAPR